MNIAYQRVRCSINAATGRLIYSTAERVQVSSKNSFEKNIENHFQIEHPCIDNKHTCGDKFCHRIIKPNERSQAYECIDEDEECLGIVMCEEYFFGHCAWGYNINNATQAISVTSLDDCYNHCKNIEETVKSLSISLKVSRSNSLS